MRALGSMSLVQEDSLRPKDPRLIAFLPLNYPLVQNYPLRLKILRRGIRRRRVPRPQKARGELYP